MGDPGQSAEDRRELLARACRMLAEAEAEWLRHFERMKDCGAEITELKRQIAELREGL